MEAGLFLSRSSPPGTHSVLGEEVGHLGHRSFPPPCLKGQSVPCPLEARDADPTAPASPRLLLRLADAPDSQSSLIIFSGSTPGATASSPGWSVCNFQAHTQEPAPVGRASRLGRGSALLRSQLCPRAGRYPQDMQIPLTPKASAKAVAPSFSRRFLPATKTFRASGLPWALDFR